MADEQVDLKFSADSHAAQTALEQIAASLSKLGDQGQEAGRKHREGSDWASEGLQFFETHLLEAVSAGALFEKGVEAINARMETLKKRMDDAAEASSRAAAGQHAWLDFLRPGDDPQKIQQRLDAAGEQARMAPGGMDQVLGGAIQFAAEHGREVSTDELVKEAAAAAATTPIPGTAEHRAQMIGALRQRRPEFTIAGAVTELGRGKTAWTGKVQELVEGLSPPGSHDDYRTLSSFAQTIISNAPEGIESNTLLKMVDQLIGKEEAATGSKHHSLKEALDYFRGNPRGQAEARQIIDQAAGSTGKGGLGGRNATLAHILKGIIGGEVPLAEGADANAPPSAAQKSLKEASEAMQTQTLEGVENKSAQTFNEYDVSSPDAIKASSRKIREGTISKIGTMNESLQDTFQRPRDFPWSAPTPQEEIAADEKMLREMLGERKYPTYEHGETPQETQRQIDVLEKQLALLQSLESLLQEPPPQRITITDSHGNEHQAATVPVGK